MIKILNKDKEGVLWFPVNDGLKYHVDEMLVFHLENTLNGIYRQCYMIITNAGSNYIAGRYGDFTFKGLPDGEYVVSLNYGRKRVNQWLLHIGPYYTQSPMKDIKTPKNDTKEIKSFV